MFRDKERFGTPFFCILGSQMEPQRASLEFGTALKCDRGASKTTFSVLLLFAFFFVFGPLFFEFETPEGVAKWSLWALNGGSRNSPGPPGRHLQEKSAKTVAQHPPGRYLQDVFGLIFGHLLMPLRAFCLAFFAIFDLDSI